MIRIMGSSVVQPGTMEEGEIAGWSKTLVGGLASPGWGCGWNQTELVSATLFGNKE